MHDYSTPITCSARFGVGISGCVSCSDLVYVQRVDPGTLGTVRVASNVGLEPQLAALVFNDMEINRLTSSLQSSCQIQQF